ncbi:MAG: glycosyltransferase family 4 protein [Candidatus Omnitrophica bacterium]|nr:glycosyltransferase family 4 protein [Candidatus Omnitrophota bacterium]
MKADTGKKIRFILQYFYPEVASTAQLMTELAQGLTARGYKIKVYCGQPTYVRSKTLLPKEVFNNIEIERLSCTRFEKNSSIGRMMNWLSYTVLTFFRLLFSGDKSPLFIISTPPFLFVVGYLLKILKGQKYVCLIYDLYPDIAVKLKYMQENSIIAKIWDRCNRAFFKNADFVIVPSENMKTLIDKKIGKNNKVKVIYNWADGDFIKPMPKSENWFAKKYDLVNKLVILYAGNIGLFHELETLIEAAGNLRDNKNIQFVFIGEGGKKKKLMDMAGEKKLDNVLFLPYQDKSILSHSLTCSDVSVVSLEKNLDFVAAPCKLYTSMAAGQAILGLVDKNSDVAKIVNRYECGFCVDQDDVKAVVETLKNLSQNLQLMDKYKRNARKCFEENFRKDIMINKYSDVFSH